MNIQEFAGILNGREYGREITKEECNKAKELGFVVVFGASDDLAEFRGAINDEAGCYDGGAILLNEIGILEPCECECTYFLQAKDKAKSIEAIWCGEGDYSWTYKTDIPHATFEILEDGEKYCRGIVFEMKELK
jgi:hypothetical protein